MDFAFSVQQHEHKAGTVFDDAVCHGVYIEVGSDECEQWFNEQGLEGNGYTILALVDSLCRLDLLDDKGKYEMEAEADNTWVYGRDKAPIDRLVAKFKECASDETGIRRLMENASKDLLE